MDFRRKCTLSPLDISICSTKNPAYLYSGRCTSTNSFWLWHLEVFSVINACIAGYFEHFCLVCFGDPVLTHLYLSSPYVVLCAPLIFCAAIHLSNAVQFPDVKDVGYVIVCLTNSCVVSIADIYL